MAQQIAHDIDTIERTEDVKIDESITFSTMLLPNFILEGLEASGFKRPSPIQLVAIPRARCGLDLIVQAKSGTGKTLVFAITALESLNVSVKRVQVIILAPTKEIAFQITEVIQSVGKSLKCLKVETFVGGKPLNSDKPLLQGCQIAVGCPGRIRHLIEKNLLDSLAVRLLVLDEADKLFDNECDFQKDINFIFNKCGESKQVLAVSATYPPPLVEFTNRFMRSGQVVTPAGGPAPVLLGLRQFILVTKDHPDYNARLSFKEKELFNILNTTTFDLCCIFHHYSSRAESMNNILRKKGFSSVFLTGKQSLEERQEAMGAIKSGKCRILVTTDIAARGIDSSGINLVINMSIPWNSASYLHRMGRAGRFGSQGVCISLISAGMELNKFQKLLGKIGGTSMGVHVIPKNHKFDIWNDALDVFEKIYGVLSLDEECEEDLNYVSEDIVNTLNDNDNDIVRDLKVLPNEKLISLKNSTKNINSMSLKALQNELNKFVEQENEVKNSSNTRKKEKLKENNFPLSYSQMVCSKKQSPSSAASSSSLESSNFVKAPQKKTVRVLTEKSPMPSSCPRFLSALNDSKSSKRKRGGTNCSSTSSEFESFSYEEDCSDETLSYSILFTADKVEGDSCSGIDLNAEHDDFESLSDISLNSKGSPQVNSFYSEPQKNYLQPNLNDYGGYYSTDWYSVISCTINNYVTYSRRFRVMN